MCQDSKKMAESKNLLSDYVTPVVCYRLFFFLIMGSQSKLDKFITATLFSKSKTNYF